jgi:ketosteroid isomerase-like protein
MAEEAATPDPVELTRRSIEAGGSGDFDAMVSVFAPDGVWDMSPLGIGVFEGRAAIRGFLEDWIGSYEGFKNRVEEVQDLGNGVLFVVSNQDARLVGSSSRLQELWAVTVMWRAGFVEHVATSRDLDEARAAAERLAKERG